MTDEYRGVTLIQCTNTKRDGPAPARDLYDESRYFRCQRRLANAKQETDGQPWFILSGKYGLLHPDEVIGDYDARGIDEQQARDAAVALDAMGFDRVDIQAGRDYTDNLVPELEARGIGVVNHFAGENIGVRQRKCNQRAEELRCETL